MQWNIVEKRKIPFAFEKTSSITVFWRSHSHFRFLKLVFFQKIQIIRSTDGSSREFLTKSALEGLQ